MGFENNLMNMIERLEKEIEDFCSKPANADPIEAAESLGRINALEDITLEIREYFQEIL